MMDVQLTDDQRMIRDSVAAYLRDRYDDAERRRIIDSEAGWSAAHWQAFAGELGLLGDVKPVGEGVFEMREDFGPGWRMYYVQRGAVIVVMLGGGDKSTQDNDIVAAKALSKTLED